MTGALRHNTVSRGSHGRIVYQQREKERKKIEEKNLTWSIETQCSVERQSWKDEKTSFHNFCYRNRKQMTFHKK
jgi:hypothetical protein